jgi:hypothetical protein
MGQRSVRVVVGRGDPSGADIRAMLEGDGFLVVGEASSAEDLARLVQANPPDVVVLDDAIGVAAVQAVSELAPETKLVVIWPASVLPIAGATRIDAADLHTTLAPAVAAAAGLLAGLTSIDRPEWIDAVRKDPASLREKLAASSGLPVRPSITELQRPHGYRAPSTGWRRRSSRPVSPLAASAAAASVTSLPTPEEDATVNRRLGMIALGGAVAAGALMIALSFGRPTPTVVSAEPFVPGISAPSNFIPDPTGGDTTAGGGGTAPEGTQGGGNGPTTGNGGSSTTSPSGSGTTSGTPTIGAGSSGGGVSGGDVRTVTHQSAGHPGTGGGQGSQGGGVQGPGSQTPGAPGNSGDHNPHGGPPGQTGDDPGQGGGQPPSHPVHPSDQQVHRHKR